MSTYWYLECLDHDPVLRSSDEVEQHTEGLVKIDVLASRMSEIADYPEDVRDAIYEALTYFERNAYWFLIAHPNCNIRYRSEYGHYRPLLKPREMA